MKYVIGKTDDLEDVCRIARRREHRRRRGAGHIINGFRSRHDEHVEPIVIRRGAETRIAAIGTNHPEHVGKSRPRLIHLAAPVEEIGKHRIAIAFDATLPSPDLFLDRAGFNAPLHLGHEAAGVPDANAAGGDVNVDRLGIIVVAMDKRIDDDFFQGERRVY